MNVPAVPVPVKLFISKDENPEIIVVFESVNVPPVAFRVPEPENVPDPVEILPVRVGFAPKGKLQFVLTVIELVVFEKDT